MLRNESKLIIGAVALALSTAACGGSEGQTSERGAPTVKGPAGDGGAPVAAQPVGPIAEGDAPPPVRPDRPRKILTREDFGPETRDPFESFMDLSLAPQAAETSPLLAPRQRDVRLSTYNFEDLKLIGIVMSGRGVQPRALFVSTDGKSKTIKQGEYFSRAEVLLANVNRDYVEIEVVDEELAKGLNLAAGETRAIYLKND